MEEINTNQPLQLTAIIEYETDGYPELDIVSQGEEGFWASFRATLQDIHNNAAFKG